MPELPFCENIVCLIESNAVTSNNERTNMKLSDSANYTLQLIANSYNPRDAEDFNRRTLESLCNKGLVSGNPVRATDKGHRVALENAEPALAG